MVRCRKAWQESKQNNGSWMTANNSWLRLLSYAEASSSEQLPRVSEKDGTCGQQAAACIDPYPCCSATGQCGCTAAHCGIGCQTLYGTCGKSTSPAVTAVPPAATTLCGHAWVQAAMTENNRLRDLSGALALTCDEEASKVATSWSEEMCQYASSLAQL